MRVPKKVICEFADMGDNFICEVDKEGRGWCGDAVLHDFDQLCPWANEMLEWQDIKPGRLKGYMDEPKEVY